MGQAGTPWEWHTEGWGIPEGSRLGLPGMRGDSMSCPIRSRTGRHGCGEAPGPAGGRERAAAAGDESVRGRAAGAAAAAAAAGTVPGLPTPAGEPPVVALVTGTYG